MKVLVTCPPMLGLIDEFIPAFAERGITVTAPEVVQTLSVTELVKLLPEHDGWIIGDDPANKDVFAAGRAGRLRAAVKWGVGVDNVDFSACEDLGISVTHTPGMFGAEVADVAMGYVIALARETFGIDQGVREGGWPKPRGISLAGKVVALIGYGDIGRNTAQRLLAAGMRVIVYDPAVQVSQESAAISQARWPERIEEVDFVVLTCSLTPASFHLINADVLSTVRRGVRIVNVGRGAVIDEGALIEALQSGQVHSAALDVFEHEPLPSSSYLRLHPKCVLGSHNASNTYDAVVRTSCLAMDKLFAFLGVQR